MTALKRTEERQGYVKTQVSGMLLRLVLSLMNIREHFLPTLGGYKGIASFLWDF